MKFHVPQKELVAVLSRCSSIASRKETMQVLSYVLLDPGESVLKVCATDLEIGYTAGIHGLVWDDETGKGAFLLPAKTLHDCIKSIPSGEIQFSVENSTAKISGGTVTFNLAGLDPSEFPGIAIEQGSEITIDVKSLVSVFKNVAYCQSHDFTKYTLNGVFLQLEHNEDGDLFAVATATDGHRLCQDTTGMVPEESDTPAGEQIIPPCLVKGVVVPSKGIAEIIKLVSAGPSVMGIVGNTLYISLGDEMLSVQLVEGDFPDVNRVIPKDTPITIQVKRQALYDALERCRITTLKKYRGIKFLPDGDALVLTSAIPDIGAETTDHVTAEITGEAPPMSFNVEYMLQALDNMTSALVDIRIKDALAPVIINPVGTDFPQAIVMPMRV